MADSLDLFPTVKYSTRPEAEHKEALEQFKAAVMASRLGNGDSIKQVRVLLRFRFVSQKFELLYQFFQFGAAPFFGPGSTYHVVLFMARFEPVKLF